MVPCFDALGETLPLVVYYTCMYIVLFGTLQNWLDIRYIHVFMKEDTQLYSMTLVLRM